MMSISYDLQFKYNKSCDLIEDNECIICFEDYNTDMNMYMLPCCHIFHYECLIEWFDKYPTCPFCRLEIKFYNPVQVGVPSVPCAKQTDS